MMSVGSSQSPEQRIYATVWDMKPEEIKDVESEMQPGVLVISGYLPAGKGLLEKCEEDRSYLKAKGVSIDTIYFKLEDLIRRTESIREKAENVGTRTDSVVLDKKWKISWDQQYSEEPCPFSETKQCGKYEGGNTEYHLQNLQSKQWLYFSDSSMHLLKVHHFFYNPYWEEMGLSPEHAIRVLEVANSPDKARCQYPKNTRMLQFKKDLIDNDIPFRITI